MTRRETFEAGERPRVSIQVPSGDIRIVEGAHDTIEVFLDGSDSAVTRFTVEKHGDTVDISPDKGSVRRWSSVDVVVSGPPGMAVDARLKSADLDIEVPLRWLEASVASGDVRARDIEGDATIKTASGDIRLGAVGGRCEISAASGDIRVDHTGGECTVNSASGDIVVGSADDRVRFRSAAGDVSLGSCRGPEFEAKTVSGDVRLGIPPGRTIDVDVRTLSGGVVNALTPSEGEKTGRLSLRVKTVSGNIEFHPGD